MSASAGEEEAYIAAARRALQLADGTDALDGLGWWDLLDHIADPDARVAIYAVFRAQGNELISTGAVNVLMAAPFAEAVGSPPCSLAIAITLRSATGDDHQVVVGELAADLVLIDRPGAGVVAVKAEDIDVGSALGGAGTAIRSLRVRGPIRPVLDEPHALPLRRRSRFLGHVALAHELLGAAEATLDLAVEHARTREQFQQPIGTFQAVRHLLAWAAIDCSAAHAVCSEAVRLDADAPALLGSMAKAVAGRSARRTCERTLQVLGAIGFTEEHRHHRFHNRVLEIDPLLGGSDELTHDIAAATRNGFRMSELTQALLSR